MILAAALATLAIIGVTGPAVEWKSLEIGMELTWLAAKSPSPIGDSRITVVRVDPKIWKLDLLSASVSGEPEGMTAREWARNNDLAVATNAGMFGSDYKTHVGYMECRGHINSKRVNHYQSIAAFDARHPETQPPFHIFDLDDPDITVQAIRKQYASLVQNLRLVKRPGRNRWRDSNMQWSEVALGEDDEGKILLIYSRSPFSMHDLNEELLSAGFGLVALQHLEGGPEAQIYLSAGDTKLELFGSYETSFRKDDENSNACPIPNVLGVRRKTVGSRGAYPKGDSHR